MKADPVQVENIPVELRDRPQWCPWDFEKNFKPKKPGQKPSKIPKSWRAGGGEAASNNPDTWTTFEIAVKTYQARAYTGIAYMLNNDYTLFDIDNCVTDGTLTPFAQEVVEKFNTYTEISVSKTGIKGICKGSFKGKGMNVKGVGETYCNGRMFCFTGDHLPGTPPTVSANQGAIDWWIGKLLESKVKPATPASSGTVIDNEDQDALVERCWKYIQKCPDAISGEGGHNATFHAACECFKFGLDDEHARLVMDRFNAEKTDGDAWSDEELSHKLTDARKEVEAAGEVGIRLKRNDVVDKKDPLPLARRFIQDRYGHPEHPKLVHADDEHWAFNGTFWEIVKPQAIRQQLYGYVEPLKIIVTRGETESFQPFRPTSRDIDNLMDAVRAATFTTAQAPAWIGADAWAQPDLRKLPIIAATNGIFDVSGGKLAKICDPTPRLFTTTALDYPLEAEPCPPYLWMEFLNTIFNSDQQMIDLLQEWFGYCLTGLTRMQKMLLVIGPKRSGKGTIARVLTAVVGPANVAAPTLAGLGTNFGLWPLVGKSVAIVGDARLGTRSDQSNVTERLLTISGEDAVTIDRKNREMLTTRLSTRIMLLSNELPKLADASGALASRFLILRLRKSFFNEEDTNLTERLVEECKGIAAWALKGLERLTEEWRFTTPAASDDLRAELDDLASPIKAFVADWCHVDVRLEIDVADLYAGWCAWCDEQGQSSPGTQQVFGRDLRAVAPSLDVRQPREGGKRVRTYVGIGLTAQALLSAQKWRSARDGTRSTGVHVRREEGAVA